MSQIKKKKGFSRRKFLVRSAAGVGVLLGTAYLTKPMWRRAIAGFADTADAPYLGGKTDSPSVWFEVTADNQMFLYSPKVEMGQGVFTGLAQIAADELGVDIAQMVVKHAPSITGNVDAFATGGSTSISSLWTPLRELAATFREMIKQQAAKQMGTEISQLSVSKGIVTGGGKSMTYGEVVKNVTEWEVPDTPKLKDLKEYQFIGKPVARVDLKDKVIGAPIFGMDAEMPDMLYGAVVRPSSIDATFVSADTSDAEQMPGVVKIVLEKDFVGVVAKSRMEAHLAKKAIKVNWKVNKVWQKSDIEAKIKVGQGHPVSIQKEGDAKGLLENNDTIFTQEYSSPIGAHAQMEPNGCVAYVDGDKVTIKMSTQVIEITRKEVAASLGISKEDVNIIPTFLGGGFGRRLHTPNAVQAALMSKAVGKPVKCFFDRKEEFQNDTFRPPTHHVLKAKLTNDGNIEAMIHNVSSGDVAYGSPLLPGFLPKLMGADVGAWRGGMINYSKIPNYEAISWRVKLPFATSWWRSLGLLANTFAIETFMDELAHKAGKDPIQFRLDHIDTTESRGNRLAEVIKVARDKSDWKKGSLPEGHALGFACSVDVNIPCAHVVDISVKEGKIKVHKVTCVLDPGLVINPDQVRAQCEGSIVMGLSAALYEKMDVVDNELRPTIYGPYQMALLKDAPKEIEVVLLESTGDPGGVGEPPLGPIGAAIGNAVFAATGERLRAMPLQK